MITNVNHDQLEAYRKFKPKSHQHFMDVAVSPPLVWHSLIMDGTSINLRVESHMAASYRNENILATEA